MSGGRIAVHMAAEEKDGLTLAELRLFVEQCNSAGVRDDARITGLVNWRQRLREIGVLL
jgi:hypothetical protein